ncbi:MAG: hypothetical protein ACRETZ_03850 [Steroidobacteraceae bacterium]
MAGSDTWLGRDERMPPMAAAWIMHAGRRVVAAAIALAFQGVFYWLILHETLEPTAAPKSTPLEVSISTATSRPRPAPLTRKRRRPTLTARPPIQKAVSPAAAPIEQPTTVPRLAKPAPHAPIDWRQGIQGEVRAEQSRSRPRKLDFGFPHERAAVSPAPAFGWDYAHTHRIVPLPHGGMIINFSDRCSINVWFPIPFCRFGKIPANGHLFDDMHDSTSDRPGGLP